jgi:hypothetical protein
MATVIKGIGDEHKWSRAQDAKEDAVEMPDKDVTRNPDTVLRHGGVR